jgi:hypothetical protein
MAGISLDCILIGFAVAVLAVLNVLVARMVDGHLQAGFRSIVAELGDIRQELRSGQAEMRSELREALTSMVSVATAMHETVRSMDRGQRPGPAE